MECRQDKNLKICPCTWPDCPRKGICCECLNYHRQREELPACYFSAEAERTYDRSIENFINGQKKEKSRNVPDF